MELGRTERVVRFYDLAATLDDGTAVELLDVAVAVLPARTRPDDDTTWTAADYSGGTATVVLAGPDADDTGALAVSVDADVWLRVIDDPETITVRAERIRLL